METPAVVIAPDVRFTEGHTVESILHLNSTAPALTDFGTVAVGPDACFRSLKFGNGIVKCKSKVAAVAIFQRLREFGNVQIINGIGVHEYAELGYPVYAFEPYSGLRGKVSGAYTTRKWRVPVIPEASSPNRSLCSVAFTFSKSPKPKLVTDVICFLNEVATHCAGKLSEPIAPYHLNEESESTCLVIEIPVNEAQSSAVYVSYVAYVAYFCKANASQLSHVDVSWSARRK